MDEYAQYPQPSYKSMVSDKSIWQGAGGADYIPQYFDATLVPFVGGVLLVTRAWVGQKWNKEYTMAIVATEAESEEECWRAAFKAHEEWIAALPEGIGSESVMRREHGVRDPADEVPF